MEGAGEGGGEGGRRGEAERQRERRLVHHVGRYVYTGALWRIMFVIGVYAAQRNGRGETIRR